MVNSMVSGWQHWTAQHRTFPLYKSSIEVLNMDIQIISQEMNNSKKQVLTSLILVFLGAFKFLHKVNKYVNRYNFEVQGHLISSFKIILCCISIENVQLNTMHIFNGAVKGKRFNTLLVASFSLSFDNPLKGYLPL